MAAPAAVVQAVQTAIVASAHLSAFEHVSAAAQACRRLGALTSGRWRSVARDLDRLESELQAAFATSAEEVADRASELDVPEEALWTAGDAAATLDLLRDSALEELEDQEGRAAQLLRGRVLFGVAFLEDEELSDRGTTLLFGWPEPLAPASWPWQASWVTGDGQAGEEGDELDLYETGELANEQGLLAELAEELGCSREDARAALRELAVALTRASLLAGVEDADEDEDEDEEDAAGGGSDGEY
ncbi:MAG: hypothetical protein M3336_00965 [Chloroflexota bacterium]|nr:hypothetical protein [Chloroflexota bacterium]